ncbi:hypothetical protein [Bacillus pseudomycoides]|uniref:hypothetical protein n=1 Tax=Bacillus pseudomycoides TaxID=64104 RepID=UPI000534A696|nr:hypothetical protein [Bacillus pseudomycoides]MED0855708.1 hypothetical protein [Bacillus pseudomycoides]PFW93916.1 hypothetical protein COL29_12315 [Bacillus pseudomycoides]PFX43521.1 hypothetical protein COL32_14405 [Bacillus pseudomycoides]PGA60752.1 hypothetical protein COL87_30980 [Bacillus pseudomycoides]PGC41230.1 hypothetical protein COM18_11925 [Bacillus pseudomycoides]
MHKTAIKIEEIYREILEKKRTRFPNHTWSEDTNRELAIRVTKYLIEFVLKWNMEDVKKNWNKELIDHYKLGGLLVTHYRGSPYAMLNDAYPNQFKEWEMNAPQRFWTKEKALEALRWTIEEKEKLSDQQLRETYNIYWLEKHQLSSPVQIHYRGSPYAMLNQLYPGKFKEKEINKNLRVFKTKEEALEVLRWTIEEKEKLSNQQLLKVYDLKWLRKVGLEGVCNYFWNSSPYAMLNDLYPNCFKEWELKVTPKGFWTKEKALEALRWTIEEKEKLTDQKLMKAYSRKWLKERKLGFPLDKYWNGATRKMLNELYPGRFKEWEFNIVSKGFWTKEKALEALRWTIEEKEKLTDQELMKVYSCKWLKERKLGFPLEKYWNSSPFKMLDELYPNRFKEWELKVTPKGFWTKEKALEALRWTIEEKEKLTDQELMKVYSCKWLKERGFSHPLIKYWNGASRKMLNELYPDRLKE